MRHRSQEDEQDQDSKCLVPLMALLHFLQLRQRNREAAKTLRGMPSTSLKG